MKKHEYGESSINKYIPFINQGRKIERERILKVIDKLYYKYKEKYSLSFSQFWVVVDKTHKGLKEKIEECNE
jgi:hypothetical protein